MISSFLLFFEKSGAMDAGLPQTRQPSLRQGRVHPSVKGKVLSERTTGKSEHLLHGIVSGAECAYVSTSHLSGGDNVVCIIMKNSNDKCRPGKGRGRNGNCTSCIVNSRNLTGVIRKQKPDSISAGFPSSINCRCRPGESLCSCGA